VERCLQEREGGVYAESGARKITEDLHPATGLMELCWGGGLGKGITGPNRRCLQMLDPVVTQAEGEGSTCDTGRTLLLNRGERHYRGGRSAETPQKPWGTPLRLVTSRERIAAGLLGKGIIKSGLHFTWRKLKNAEGRGEVRAEGEFQRANFRAHHSARRGMILGDLSKEGRET